LPQDTNVIVKRYHITLLILHAPAPCI